MYGLDVYPRYYLDSEPTSEREWGIEHLDIPEGAELAFIFEDQILIDPSQVSPQFYEARRGEHHDFVKGLLTVDVNHLMQEGHSVHPPDEISALLKEAGRELEYPDGRNPSESDIQLIRELTGATHVVYAYYVSGGGSIAVKEAEAVRHNVMSVQISSYKLFDTDTGQLVDGVDSVTELCTD
jgi:hypothetical protein